MILDCVYYRGGRREREGAVSIADAATRAARLDGFVWVAIRDPTEREMDELGTYFPVHELAVDHVRSTRQSARLQDYGNHYFVALRTASYDRNRRQVEFGEINIFAGPGYAITVQRGGGAELLPARARLESSPDLLQDGPIAVVWAVLDTVVDAYEPVVDGLSTDVEDAEIHVFEGESDQAERIYLLKRETVEFHRALHPLLVPLAEIERGENPRISDDMRNYFRDVGDHLTLVHDDVNSQRELLTSILEANVAVLGVRQKDIGLRQNETIAQLTLIATIFFPLTVITGFFGMNFDWLERHIASFWSFLGYGVGSLALTSLGLGLWLWRRRAPSP